MMPLPQVWAVFFFLMIIFLGLDTQFVYLEGMVTSIADMYPSFFYAGHRRKLLLLLICCLCFFTGLLMVTEGGLYIFLLFDYYACSGIPILFFAILESCSAGWIFGADRYYDKVMEMIGYRPSPYMKYCWRFFTPFVCGGILIFSLVMFTPLRYNKTYHYPMWGYALGIFFSLSSALLPPLIGLYLMTTTQGTIRQRLKTLCTPAADLLKRRKTLCPESTLIDTVSGDMNLAENPKGVTS